MSDKNSLMASLMGDGGGAGGGTGGEQDLFGDVPIDDEPPFAASNTPPVPPAVNGLAPPLPVGASIPPPAGAGVVPTQQGQQQMAGAVPPPTNQPFQQPPEMTKQPHVNGGNEVPAPAMDPPAVPAPAPAQSLLSKSGLLGMAADGMGGGSEDGGGLFDAVDEEEKQKEEAERRAREEEERKRKEAEEAAARLKQQQEAEEAERKRQQEEQMRQQQEQLRQQQLQQQQQYGQQSQYGVPQGQQQQPMYQQPQQQSVYGGVNGQPSPMQQSGMMQQQQQPMYQQQQSAMMQSTVMTPQTQQQEQLNSQMNNMQLNSPGQAPNHGGFYREHQQIGGGPPQQIQTGPSNAYHGGGAAGAPGNNNYYYGTQPHSTPPRGQMTPQQHPHQQHPGGMVNSPNIAAGMHNPAASMGQVRKIIFQKPQDVAPMYTDIKVTEPMLIQNASFLLSSTPYWSYQITSVLSNNQGTWLVRRRFRHVVALEDRLRQACPGSILPPRPDKHATRALEEASAQQSAEFAIQRAKELEQYLNMLAKHPVAGQSNVLRLFLGLQDDIGTAWAEVSTNAFTRLGAVGAEMSMKVAESTNLTSASAPAHEWEDNAELLALQSSENVRMGAVSQAVPKLEGAVTLLREHGDAAGAVGMELSKIGKSAEDFKACEVLSNAMLRNGRRTKRLALEMSAALDSFLTQYKLVRYEKMAMQDRRQAIQRRGKERRGADSRAYALAQQQRQLQAAGRFDQLQNLEQSAIYGDQHALDVGNEADEIGARLKSEIHRVAITRRKEWNNSMKTVATSMKEAATEQRVIWEATLESLQQQLADMSVIQDTSTIVA